MPSLFSELSRLQKYRSASAEGISRHQPVQRRRSTDGRAGLSLRQTGSQRLRTLRLAAWTFIYLQRQIVYAVGIQLVAAAVIAGLFWQRLPQRALPLSLLAPASLWMGATWWCFRLLRPGPAHARPTRTVALFCAAVSAWAVAWALACWMLLPATLPEQLALLTIMLVLTAGTSQALTPCYPAVACFLLSSLLPLCLHLLLANEPHGLPLAVLLLVSLPLYLKLCRKTYRAALAMRLTRIASEQRVQRLHQQLAAESALRDRTAQALAQSQQACRENARFIATASHDLRQPAHAIGLFVAAIKQETDSGTRVGELIERLDRAMLGLDQMFNRLLDISRLDSGAIAPNPGTVDARPLLLMLESRFAAQARSQGLRLRIHCGKHLQLHTDSELLVEIIMNLLSNAFRFTRQGGVLLAVRPRADHALVQVWDTGCGIAEDNVERIFEEFVQLDNPAHDRRNGLGLGLSIVKRLCARMGLPVRLRSRVGRGTVFEIEVPRVRQAAVMAYPAQDAGLPVTALAGSLVVVVDDEPDILSGMGAVLASWGCHALLARSLGEARRLVESSERYPDVVIADHRLGHYGNKTSFDVMASLHDLLPEDTPVIVISGDASPSLRQGIETRGWHFMSKPVNPARLSHALAQAIAGDGVQPRDDDLPKVA